jgi:hypothetical protein
MTPGDPKLPLNRGVVAGTLLVATMLLCIAIGLGIGALIGAPALLGISGLFVGLIAGFALVHSRFKDL